MLILVEILGTFSLVESGNNETFFEIFSISPRSRLDKSR